MGARPSEDRTKMWGHGCIFRLSFSPRLPRLLALSVQLLLLSYGVLGQDGTTNDGNGLYRSSGYSPPSAARAGEADLEANAEEAYQIPPGSEDTTQTVVRLDEHASIRGGSLECDELEVRGVLRNSGGGVPRDLAVGAVVGAEDLRCEGSTSPHMLRVVSEVTYREGSAMFSLVTYDILRPESECSTNEKMRIRDGGVELCVQQEELPLVRILRSTSNVAKGTHNIFMHVPSEALSLMNTPGVSPEDVYIAYTVSRAKADAVEAECGLTPADGAVYNILQNSSGVVSIRAPYHVCVKACSRTAFLKGSPSCVTVSFDASDPTASQLPPEDSPMDFVDEGADPKADALASQEAKAERNYRMSPSMVGLAVGCSVAAVIIIIVAFVAVRCAIKSNREIVANYMQTAGQPASTPPVKMTEVAVRATRSNQEQALKVSGAVAHDSQQLPPRTPKAPQVLAPLRSPYSSSTPLERSLNRADFGTRSLNRYELGGSGSYSPDIGTPMMRSLDRAEMAALRLPAARGDSGTPMMRSLDRAELGMSLSRLPKQSSVVPSKGSKV